MPEVTLSGAAHIQWLTNGEYKGTDILAQLEATLKGYSSSSTSHRVTWGSLISPFAQFYFCPCSGLNVCVSSEFICWNPNHKGDSISRWGLWEVTRSWRWSSHEGDWCSYKETPQGSLAPSVTWGHSKKAPAMNREEAPHQKTWPCWCLDLGIPVSRTVRNKFLLFISYPSGGVLS